MVATVAASACRDDAPPAPEVPAALALVEAPAAVADVGAAAGSLRVRVTDATGRPLRGVPVGFVVTRGTGRVARELDTTDVAGNVATAVFAGTSAGPNEFTALVNRLAPLTAVVTGVAGAARSLGLSTRAVRLGPTTDSVVITAFPRDEYNNAAGGVVAWSSSDTSLVTVASRTTSSATVRVARRPGFAFVVAASGPARDSVSVAAHDAQSGACDFVADDVVLAPGGTAQLEQGVACLPPAQGGAEYLLVAHHNSAVQGISGSVEAVASGVVAPTASFPRVISGEVDAIARDERFERELRLRERAEGAPRVAGARAWFRNRPSPVEGGALALSAASRVGDMVSLNVNARDFCGNPTLVTARVAAVSTHAVVLADAANPDGGFTDAEYGELAAAFDTLVHPVTTGAFGTPSDIDGNGRTAILFTRAVNALTPSNSAGVVLGYYYLRDLLPRAGIQGECPGSNVAEIFYLLVPDPQGTVNANVRTKGFVSSVTLATIAHEYQHLINASRRMYATDAHAVNEEVWLNEGLSHVAEELVFHRVAGLSPRSNIGAPDLPEGSAARAAFDRYVRSNVALYRDYQRFPEQSSPLLAHDGFSVRGAAWSFLRYLADRVAPADGDFWRRLVDHPHAGVRNLDGNLAGAGLTTLAALGDWSLSVAIDDVIPATPARLQQPSWNFVSLMPAVLPGFGLAPRIMADGAPQVVSILAGGSAYFRLAVGGNREALLRVAGSGGRPLPAGVRVTLVRIR
jgi:hypothetical protein